MAKQENKNKIKKDESANTTTTSNLPGLKDMLGQSYPVLRLSRKIPARSANKYCLRIPSFHFPASHPSPFFILLISQLDILQKVIVVGRLSEGIRRTIAHHKRIQFVSIQMGDLFDYVRAETVVDILIMFLVPPADAGKASIRRLWLTRRALIELVEIEPHAGARPSGLVSLKGFGF